MNLTQKVHTNQWSRLQNAEDKNGDFGCFDHSVAVPVQKSFLDQLVALLFFVKFEIKNYDCFRRKPEISKL